MSFSERVRGWLGSERMPWLAAGLALLLSLPSLGAGLQTDDHMLLERLDQGGSPMTLFATLEDWASGPRWRGQAAWWSGEVTVRFLRPVAALTHAFDHALFRDHAWAMHLQNALLYAALALLAALAFRRVIGAGATAGVAAAMFAVDDAHAAAMGWISSRNTLLAALFALGALLLHVRGGRARWLAALCTAGALFSAEAGLAALALLGAYALVLEDGPLARRLLGLWPHLLVTAGWAAVYLALGAGIRDTGWYHDPHEPVQLLVQGVLDTPVWLASQLVFSGASAAVLLPAAVVRAASALLLLPFALALWPALRASRPARFFALALLLCVVLLWTTVPQDRNLVAASFGGFGLVACALQALAQRASAWARTGRYAFNALHLVIAPLLFLPNAANLGRVDRGLRALADAVSADRDAVVIALPLELMTFYTWSLRAEAGLGGPPSLHQLYAGSSPLTVTRVDARTLDVEVANGWGHAPIEHVFASARHLRSLATRPTRVHGFVATVLASTPDGRPARVRFAFERALEENRTWLTWQGTRPVPFALPAIGERVQLPALNLLTATD